MAGDVDERIRQISRIRRFYIYASASLFCYTYQIQPNTNPETSALRLCCHSPQYYKMFGPLGATLAPCVQSSRTLSKWITPIAHWYANAAGWRKYGFKYDDLCAPLNRTALTQSLTLLFQWWRKTQKCNVYVCAGFAVISYSLTFTRL
jgi:hypothetical protein